MNRLNKYLKEIGEDPKIRKTMLRSFILDKLNEIYNKCFETASKLDAIDVHKVLMGNDAVDDDEKKVMEDYEYKEMYGLTIEDAVTILENTNSWDIIDEIETITSRMEEISCGEEIRGLRLGEQDELESLEEKLGEYIEFAKYIITPKGER